MSEIVPRVRVTPGGYAQSEPGEASRLDQRRRKGEPSLMPSSRFPDSERPRQRYARTALSLVVFVLLGCGWFPSPSPTSSAPAVPAVPAPSVVQPGTALPTADVIEFGAQPAVDLSALAPPDEAPDCTSRLPATRPRDFVFSYALGGGFGGAAARTFACDGDACTYRGDMRGEMGAPPTTTAAPAQLDAVYAVVRSSAFDCLQGRGVLGLGGGIDELSVTAAGHRYVVMNPVAAHDGFARFRAIVAQIDALRIALFPSADLVVNAPRVRGSVRLEDGEAVGGDGDFAAAQVVALLRQRLSAIRACYENQLLRNPTLAGRVTVQFTIETTGSVRDVRAAENTTNDPSVGTCVTGVVSRFRWNPGPEGGSVTFSYPIVFSPQS